MRLTAVQLDLLASQPVGVSAEQASREAGLRRELLLLLQQQQLGLAVQDFVQGNEPLRLWFEAFTSHSPVLLEAGETLLRYRRSLQRQDGLWLSAEYDLLVLGQARAQVILLEATTPVQGWRSRLAPYLLVETRAYAPGAITLTHWSPHQTQTVHYSLAAHQQTQAELERLLHSLETLTPLAEAASEAQTWLAIQEIPL